MPPARRSTAKKARRSPRKKTAKKTSRPRALAQLEKSIDTAQGALKDLRTELGRGGRELLKDLEKTLADSRKSLRSLTKTVTQDLERLQKAATPRRAKKTARKRTGARKTTARKSASKSTARSKVKKAMHERKEGTLKSGRSGKKVTSRKQAIAIGLSEARKRGAKIPKKRGS